jgi:hypothetical protein
MPSPASERDLLLTDALEASIQEGAIAAGCEVPRDAFPNAGHAGLGNATDTGLHRRVAGDAALLPLIAEETDVDANIDGRQIDRPGIEIVRVKLKGWGLAGTATMIGRGA